MQQRLDGKRIMIVGAGRGVGLAAAHAFRAQGATLMLVGRGIDALNEAAASLESGVHVMASDLRTVDACDAAVNKAFETMGGLDGVLNCAGTFVWKKYTELTLDEWEDTLATNLTLPHLITQSASRRMIAEKAQGSIVHIASIHGAVADGNVVAQCAAKLGLVGLCRAAAEALRPHGIRVNAVSPGAIEPESGSARSEDLTGKITQADIAHLALFLVSDESRGITGSNMDAYGITRPVVASK